MSTTTPRHSDPTENRNNSEGTMPGGGSTEEIADSKGAWDSSTSRPQDSASQIEREKPNVDMRKSAADEENRNGSGSGKDASRDRQIGSDSKEQGGGTKPPASREDLGASKARKQQ
ncbi:unnamed protein product [Sympodiomycopsis kandeliae]